MQTNSASWDNRALIAYWDRAFALSEEQKTQIRDRREDSWKDLAPSEKLFRAACSLGKRKKILDYGCGTAWAAIIAAKSGCADIIAADAAPSALESARLCAERYGVGDRIRFDHAAPGWLKSLSSETYDGFFCSNVLDVIPPETAEEIIRESARVIKRDGSVIVGLNYYLSPETAASKGLELVEGKRLYLDGVLRLVSRTDEEWEQIFSPWYAVEQLDHFAWPGEANELRRLFYLRKREDRKQ
ncbi:MAG: class I SAM-dependent methyltransferase [Clostridia bacterium]|nr:class I SAM-dependent methyltransferase [Clostridia bacterium]